MIREGREVHFWADRRTTARRARATLGTLDVMPSPVTRKQLVDALAQSSHEVYERHYLAGDKPESEMFTKVNDHDRDRARASVKVLEDLGVWSDPDSG